MTKIIIPPHLEPFERNCQATFCKDPAVADAKTDDGPWGYFCPPHLQMLCSLAIRNSMRPGLPSFVTNITSTPLELTR